MLVVQCYLIVELTSPAVPVNVLSIVPVAVTSEIVPAGVIDLLPTVPEAVTVCVWSLDATVTELLVGNVPAV